MTGFEGICQNGENNLHGQCYCIIWWRHQCNTFDLGIISPYYYFAMPLVIKYSTQYVTMYD